MYTLEYSLIHNDMYGEALEWLEEWGEDETCFTRNVKHMLEKKIGLGAKHIIEELL